MVKEEKKVKPAPKREFKSAPKSAATEAVSL
jgi:hypothetical protein